MEFEVNGIKYRVAKLDAMKQFHVARKLAPIFSMFAEHFGKAPGGKASAAQDIDFMSVLGPLAEAIGNLPDASAEFIINTCLDAVTRLDGAGWAKVRTTQIMYPDIDMTVMLQLVWRVLEANLSAFFSADRSALMDKLGRSK